MAKKKTNTKKNTKPKVKAKANGNDVVKANEEAIKEISLLDSEEEVISGSLEANEKETLGKVKTAKKASLLTSVFRSIIWLVLVGIIALIVLYFVEPKKFDIAKNKLQSLLNINLESAQSNTLNANSNSLIANVKNPIDIKTEKTPEEISEIITKSFKTLPKTNIGNINKQPTNSIINVKQAEESKTSKPIITPKKITLDDTKIVNKNEVTKAKGIEGLDVTITVPDIENDIENSLKTKPAEVAKLEKATKPTKENEGENIKPSEETAAKTKPAEPKLTDNTNNVVINKESLEPLKTNIETTKDSKSLENTKTPAVELKTIEQSKAVTNITNEISKNNNATLNTNTNDAELLEKIAKLENKISYQKKKISQMNEQSNLKIKDLESKLADTAKQRNIALTNAKSAASNTAQQDTKERMLRSVVSLNEQTSVKHINVLAEKIGAKNKINSQIKNLEIIKSKNTPTKEQFLDYLGSLKPLSDNEQDKDLPEGRALWNKLSNFPSSFVRIRDKKDVEQEKAQKEIVKDVAINILKNNYEMATESVSKLNAKLYPVEKLTSTIEDIRSREQSINEIKKILGN